MSTMLKSLLFLVVIPNCLSVGDLPEPPDIELVLMKLEPCKDMKTLPMYYDDVIVSKTSKGYQMSGSVIIDKPVGPPFLVSANISKCPNHLDMCEHFFYKDTGDVCPKLEDPNSDMAKMLKRANIDRKCPIASGKYVIPPFVIETKPEAKSMAAMAKFWKIRTMAYENNSNPVSCSDIEVKIQPAGKKRKFKFLTKNTIQTMENFET